MATLGVDKSKLQEVLGPKFEEFQPQLEEVQKRLKHSNKLYELSQPLPITLVAKKETGDIWSQNNEPMNVDTHLTAENRQHFDTRPLSLQKFEARVRP